MQIFRSRLPKQEPPSEILKTMQIQSAFASSQMAVRTGRRWMNVAVTDAREASDLCVIGLFELIMKSAVWTAAALPSRPLGHRPERRGGSPVERSKGAGVGSPWQQR
jgi:hypothetical protein